VTEVEELRAEVERLRAALERALRPKARSTDPETSHEAAYRASLNMTRNREAVMTTLAEIGRPCTDARMIARYRSREDIGHVPKQSESGLRTRRAELVTMGLVKACGTTEDGKCTLWGLVADG
jgi:hypothetical protein